MKKRITLEIGDGSFEQGFPVNVRLGKGDFFTFKSKVARLPANPRIPIDYANWQQRYLQYQHIQARRLEASPNQPIFEPNLEGCIALVKELQSNLEQWLNSMILVKQRIPVEATVKEWLLSSTERNELIQVLIQTNNLELTELPWHCWSFFEERPKAEVAFWKADYDDHPLTKVLRKKVKILAIVGDSRGIDTQTDCEYLKRLTKNQAEIEFLSQPKRQEITDQLWQQGWDILFFAGHSQTNEQKGRFYINTTEFLTISDIQEGLKQAISRGLQIAIFNSCDGVGLATELADLHFPQVIIMREPVPDQVAHKFLKNFLAVFVQGQSLYLSVRLARAKLKEEGVDQQFPGATWLPALFHNPAFKPPTWKDLVSVDRISFPAVMAVSTIITLTIAGIRYFGGLQPAELFAYDLAFQHRSVLQPTQIDPRIVVIEIDDNDVNYQISRKWHFEDPSSSLSNEALKNLINILNNHYRVSLIGLDLYRPYRYQTGDLSYLKTDNLIIVCNFNSSKDSPPKVVPLERLGFSNWPEEDLIRRQILSVNFKKDNLDCGERWSFSYLMALHYLLAGGKETIQSIESKLTPLTNHYGGYQKLYQTEAQQGYELLINYSLPYQANSFRNRFQSFNLESILEKSQEIDPEQLKGKIVIVGTTQRSGNKDLHGTPFNTKLFGFSHNQLTPGVIIQANMTATILDAVLKERSLIWVWPMWLEILWIELWAFGGSMIIYSQGLKYSRLVYLTLIALGGIYGFYIALFLYSGWIPLVPSILSLLSTEAFFIFHLRKQRYLNSH